MGVRPQIVSELLVAKGLSSLWYITLNKSTPSLLVRCVPGRSCYVPLKDLGRYANKAQGPFARDTSA